MRNLIVERARGRKKRVTGFNYRQRECNSEKKKKRRRALCDVNKERASIERDRREGVYILIKLSVGEERIINSLAMNRENAIDRADVAAADVVKKRWRGLIGWEEKNDESRVNKWIILMIGL